MFVVFISLSSLAEFRNRSRYCRSSGSQSFVGFGFQEQDERNCGADGHYCDIENHIIASGRFSCPGGEHRADRHHCEEWHGQAQDLPDKGWADSRSEEHKSELQSLMRISYAIFSLNKNKHTYPTK